MFSIIKSAVSNLRLLKESIINPVYVLIYTAHKSDETKSYFISAPELERGRPKMDAFITIIGAIIFGTVLIFKDRRSFDEQIRDIIYKDKK